MNQIATESLILYGIGLSTIIVWLLALLSSVSMRRLGRLVGQARQLPLKNDALPPISIIVTAHNQVGLLQRNLPLMLEQYYPNFEVIVVDMDSKDGTKDLLEKLEEEHHNLRHTFTPPTSRDISLTRLAITLGMKAATHDWALITQADCAPISHSWLRHMANSLCHHRSAEIVLGYTRYKNPQFGKRRMQHFHLWQQMQALPYALKHGAYRTGGENFLYNRQLFMQHQGFASSATLLTGATDILVNRNSTKHNTTICVHSEAVLEREMPQEKRMWQQERLFFQETRTHFRHRFLYRLCYAYRVAMHTLNQLMLLLSMSLGVYLAQDNSLWYLLTAAAFLLGLTLFLAQGSSYNYTARIIEDRKQSYFRTAWYISLTPLWDLSAWLRHKFTSSKQFRKKYI